MYKHYLVFLLLLGVLWPLHSGAQGCTCATTGPELVVNGDFSQGNTGFFTTYTFHTQAAPGRYGIGPNAHSANPLYWGNCNSPGGGNYLWVDGNGAVSTV